MTDDDVLNILIGSKQIGMMLDKTLWQVLHEAARDHEHSPEVREVVAELEKRYNHERSMRNESLENMGIATQNVRSVINAADTILKRHGDDKCMDHT